MSEQQSPQRTCIGCRQVADQTQLMRWVREKSEGGQTAVVPDLRRRMSGRGAWLHPDPACAAAAAKKRAFNRAFRAQVSMPDEAQLTAAIDAFHSMGRADVTVQPESGSEI
ncbi:YlxR family protein [Zhihengliuella alba]|uniref:YlxR family protein n=1 Tax=Zhihengliuella alba TaxID=547018 RepID=A0ABP7D3X0_9MICC